jgi:hypothetical protein
VGLGVYERALVTDGHVCAAGARQWMVGWYVTEGMMVGSHFHYCNNVVGDYWRSATAVEAMEMRWVVEGVVAVVKSGRRQRGVERAW